MSDSYEPPVPPVLLTDGRSDEFLQERAAWIENLTSEFVPVIALIPGVEWLQFRQAEAIARYFATKARAAREEGWRAGANAQRVAQENAGRLALLNLANNIDD